MKFIVLVVHYPVLVILYNDPRTRMFEQIMDKIMVKHPEQNLFGHLHQHLWHPNGRPRIGLTDLFEHSAWTAIWVDAFRYSMLYPLKDMFKYLWLEIACVFNHWYLIWCCLMIFTIYFKFPCFFYWNLRHFVLALRVCDMIPGVMISDENLIEMGWNMFKP